MSVYINVFPCVWSRSLVTPSRCLFQDQCVLALVPGDVCIGGSPAFCCCTHPPRAGCGCACQEAMRTLPARARGVRRDTGKTAQTPAPRARRAPWGPGRTCPPAQCSLRVGATRGLRARTGGRVCNVTLAHTKQPRALWRVCPQRQRSARPGSADCQQATCARRALPARGNGAPTTRRRAATRRTRS